MTVAVSPIQDVTLVNLLVFHLWDLICGFLNLLIATCSSNQYLKILNCKCSVFHSNIFIINAEQLHLVMKFKLRNLRGSRIAKTDTLIVQSTLLLNVCHFWPISFVCETNLAQEINLRIKKRQINYFLHSNHVKMDLRIFKVLVQKSWLNKNLQDS